MSDFSSRLKFAISNYAVGAITYKSFASLIDIPYRTLQNYLSGERSPNLEALEKLAKNGINIHWLITGEGTPYRATELERPLLDKVFLLHSIDILKAAWRDGSLYDKREQDRLISFIIFNNYLRIGDVLRSLSDEGILTSPEDVYKALATGEFDDLFDAPPTSSRDLWKAQQLLKETKSRETAPPFPMEIMPNQDEVGE